MGSALLSVPLCIRVGYRLRLVAISSPQTVLSLLVVGVILFENRLDRTKGQTGAIGYLFLCPSSIWLSVIQRGDSAGVLALPATRLLAARKRGILGLIKMEALE